MWHHASADETSQRLLYSYPKRTVWSIHVKFSRLMTILFKQLRFLSEGLTLLSQSPSRVRFSSQLSAGVNPSLLVRPNRAPNVYHRNTWSYTSKQFCRGSFIPFEFTRFLSDKSKIDHNSVKVSRCWSVKNNVIVMEGGSCNNIVRPNKREKK